MVIYACVKVEKQESELVRNKKGEITEHFEMVDGKIIVSELVKPETTYELKSGLQVILEVSRFVNLYKVIKQSSQKVFQVDDVVCISAHYFIEAKKL